MATLITSIWAVLTTALDFLAVFLLFKLWRVRKELAQKEEIQKQKVYQISILKEIQERIGYSLDIEKIIDVITGSLKHLLPYSTASSMIIKEGRIVFKVNIDGVVSSTFIKNVKQNMFASLSALLGQIPSEVNEIISGLTIDDTEMNSPSSFFQIPLIVNNKVLGLINVSSTKPNQYKEQETTLLYQITEEASTALARLENVLETEKGKLTSMIAGLADGVFMIDAHKNLLIINDAAKNFLNLNQNPNFFKIAAAFANFYDFSSKIDQAISKNQAIEDKEVAINDKFFEIFITPVWLNQEGQRQSSIGISVLLHDITLEKTLNKIKEDFTYMMVHELRAPLTAIKDSAELMIEEEKVSDEHEKLLNIIDQQSKSLLEQINSVLDAAKIEAGKFTIQKSPNDIRKLIKETVETFMPQARKKQISLLEELIEPLPLVSFDYLQLTHVLNNLISNSLKFTNEGGKITVSAQKEQSLLKVSVSDNGMGISKEDQKDLFSKFYQVQKTPNDFSKKGTGLGLYITKGIVEAHGGEVGVESEENQGTTIFFYLPVDKNQDYIIPNSLQPKFATIN
jgi:signal transduction histidine kinase